MNLARDSASSCSGSDPATIPHPANARIVLALESTSPQRSAIPNSPSPRASNQPTGPAYLSLDIPSSSLMTVSARSVGVPQTAAVGCSEAANDSSEASSASRPVTSVARC